MRKASQCTALWRCKGLKCLFAGLYFFQYFHQFKGKPWSSLFVGKLLRGYTIAIITASIPMAESVLLATQRRLQVFQNSGSWIFMSRVSPSQR